MVEICELPTAGRRPLPISKWDYGALMLPSRIPRSDALRGAVMNVDE